MPRLSAILTALLVALALNAVASAEDVIFYAPFDGSADAAIAGGAKGASFTLKPEFCKGIKGQAIKLVLSRVTYATKGNITLPEGTVMFWLKPLQEWRSSKAAYDWFFSAAGEWGTTSFVSLYWYPDPNYVINLLVGKDSNNYMVAHSLAREWPANEWYFIAGAWKENDKMRLYINGRLNAEALLLPRYSLSDVGGKMSIGSEVSTAMDELTVCNRALSAEEILKAYEKYAGTIAGSGKPDSTNPRLESRLDKSKAGRLVLEDERKVLEEGLRVTVGSPRVIEFQDMPAANNRRPVLRFRVWFPASSPAGWNEFLSVSVNDKLISPYRDDGTPRLLNRNMLFGTGHWGMRFIWQGEWRMGSVNKLVTFFTNNPDVIDDDILDPEEKNEGCWYVIDLSGLITPGEKNSITFTAKDITPESYGAKTLQDVPLAFDHVSLGYIQPTTMAELQNVSFVKVGFNPAKKRPLGELTIENDVSGGLRIMAGRQTATIRSQFSVPSSEKWLLMGDVAGVDRANETSKMKRDGGSIAVKAASASLEVERQATVRNGAVFFEDSYTNAGEKPVGVIAKTFLAVEPEISRAFFAGCPLSSGGSLSSGAAGNVAANPTLFWSTAGGGVGLMVQDTVFRNQLHLKIDGNQGEFWTENLMVKPGKTVKLRWRLDLTENKDYWSFVNRLRKDLHSNYTIEGPLSWQWDISDRRGGTPPAPDNAWWCSAPKFNRLGKDVLKEFAAIPTKIYILEPWFEYYDGLDWTRADYLREFGLSKEIVHQTHPGSKVIGSLEIQLESVLRAEAGKVPWTDSIRRSEDGSLMLDGWWHVKQKEGYTYAQTYITLDNKHFQTVMDRIKFLLDDVKLDGIYFDWWSIAGTTYDRGDGFSCIIDPKTHDVKKEMCFVAILAGPAQRRITDAILSRGNKIIVANCSYGVEELTGVPIFDFLEWTEVNDLSLGKQQLMSPILLTPQLFFTTSSVLMENVRFSISRGLLPYISYRLSGDDSAGYEVMKRLFPFTPVDIRPGILMGKERLITTTPGTYLWSNTDHAGLKPDILVFDGDAKPVRNIGKIEKSADGWTVNLEDLPRGVLAVVTGI